MRYLRVKNWEKHQHYKDRNPPWIKLHREVLDDYDMSCLQDASKLHLILIWLLSSQLDNRIPDDSTWVAKKIGATQKVNLNELIDKGFLIPEQSASGVLAECSPETYREETEKEKEKINKKKFENLYEVFPKKRIGNREKAWAAFLKALTHATPEEIIAGAEAYASSAEVAEGYAKGLAAWLNDDRWLTDYAYRPNGKSPPKEAMTLEQTQKFLAELNP